MEAKGGISGYVNHLMNGNYMPSLIGMVSIEVNYKFLINLLNKNSKILEIGPGNGSFIDWLIMNGYENITYVDLDDVNVNTLCEKYKKIETIEGFSDDGINFLRRTNKKFDMIISKQVLEHLDSKNVKNYFLFSHGCLKDGGILITETINSQNIFYGNYYRYIDSTHKNSFTEKSLNEYGGDKFRQRFREYHNIGISAMLKLLFNRKYKEKYTNSLKKLFINNLPKGGDIQEREGKISRYYKFLKLLWYKNKSKRISRKYLQRTYPNSSVFTDHIISVAQKF